jgi:hypothetical protein
LISRDVAKEAMSSSLPHRPPPLTPLTPREYLDALGRLPQGTHAVDDLPHLTAHLRHRLAPLGGDGGDVDGGGGDDPSEAAALAYMKHWSNLAVLEFLAEAAVAFEKVRTGQAQTLVTLNPKP